MSGTAGALPEPALRLSQYPWAAYSAQQVLAIRDAAIDRALKTGALDGETMDLKQHKEMVWQYERLLSELSALRSVSPGDAFAATTDGSFHIPLPPDQAQTLLRDHLTQVESKAKMLAAALGITHAERA